MAEQYNSKRVFFENGKQKQFFESILTKFSIKQIADICEVSERTIRDWKREKFSMSNFALEQLCKETKTSCPDNLNFKERYWYVTKGASKGGKRAYEKYGIIGGNQNHRKKMWYKWWEQEGKFKNHLISTPFPFKKPNKSKDLAEFVGIMMGDGGMSKYQLIVTLHSRDDKAYSDYVVGLIEKLFDIKPSVYYRKDCLALNVVISRVSLVKFCFEDLGLVIGDKMRQKIDIPKWIKINSKFLLACVKGLVDTDGTIFTHSYKVNGKQYKYKKFAFTSCSKPLLMSVNKALKDLGLKPRLAAQGKDVRLDSISDVGSYFELIGSSNPKHLKNYQK